MNNKKFSFSVDYIVYTIQIWEIQYIYKSNNRKGTFNKIMYLHISKLRYIEMATTYNTTVHKLQLMQETIESAMHSSIFWSIETTSKSGRLARAFIDFSKLVKKLMQNANNNNKVWKRNKE